jgi:hypothetical protein
MEVALALRSAQLAGAPRQDFQAAKGNDMFVHRCTPRLRHVFQGLGEGSVHLDSPFS